MLRLQRFKYVPPIRRLRWSSSSTQSVWESNVKTTDAMMIGLAAKSLSDARHANLLQAQSLTMSIENLDVDAVSNLLKTRIFTTAELSGAFTLATNQQAHWQSKINSTRWFDNLAFRQRTFVVNKARAEAMQQMLDTRIRSIDIPDRLPP
jgi:hypothetical protein